MLIFSELQSLTWSNSTSVPTIYYSTSSTTLSNLVSQYSKIIHEISSLPDEDNSHSLLAISKISFTLDICILCDNCNVEV